MASLAPNLMAGGNIYPRRFCTQWANGKVVQASSPQDNVIGISQDTTRRFNSDYAAIDGDPCPLQFSNNGVFMVDAGGSCTRGQRVMSDADGKAVDFNPNGLGETTIWCGYQALDTASSGQIRVFPVPGAVYAPTAYTGLTGGGTGS